MIKQISSENLADIWMVMNIVIGLEWKVQGPGHIRSKKELKKKRLKIYFSKAKN